MEYYRNPCLVGQWRTPSCRIYRLALRLREPYVGGYLSLRVCKYVESQEKCDFQIFSMRNSGVRTVVDNESRNILVQ